MFLTKRMTPLLATPLFFAPFLAHGNAQNPSHTIYVAVAANFSHTLSQIAQKFQKSTHNKVVIITGSTGQLYAHIKNGAPYDVFLSADSKRPTLLEKEKRTLKDSRFTYAIGKLALWEPDKDIHANGNKVLVQKHFQYLAIANPKLAPYGRAAKQTLEKMQLWNTLSNRLIMGTNISQTFSFVFSGNATLGFIAESQLLQFKHPNHKNIVNTAWIVPTSFYQPIKQQAVLLLHAKNNASAKNFFDYLKDRNTRKLIKKAGHSIDG